MNFEDVTLVGIKKRKKREIDSIVKVVKKAIFENKEFFGISQLRFKITFLDSRKKLNKELKRKTQKWFVGNTDFRKKEIVILSPWVFEKESCHSAESFPKVLIHEITHLYTHKIYPFYEPKWLLEGIAYCLARQSCRPNSISPSLLTADFLAEISSSQKWNQVVEKGAYCLSFLWVKFLIESFGKKRLLDLLHKLNTDNKSINRVFDEIYPFSFSLLKKRFINSLEKTNVARRGQRVGNNDGQ